MGARTEKMLVSTALVIFALVLGTSSPTQAATKTLKIGAIMPISGPISVVGMAWTRGWELYFDKVNEEGGIKLGADTYKVDLIIEDSKLSPDAAATSARKLVYKDGAKFVFGAILSQSAAAIYQVCGPAKALHLISWIDVPGHPGDVGPQKRYAVRPCISSDVMYEMDYDYLKRTYPKTKRVIIVAPDLGYEKMIARAKKVARQRGMDIVAEEMWQIGATDFLPIYTRALAHKPDAIHCMVSAQANYQLRAARQLGFKGPFFSDSPLGPDVILAVAGKEGSHDVFCNGMDLGHPTMEMREVMNRWRAKYKEPFISDAILAWDESWILAQAIKRAGSVDPERVLGAFDQMSTPGSLKTVFGDANLGGKERFGVNRVLVRPIPLSRLANGKIEFVGMKTPVIP